MSYLGEIDCINAKVDVSQKPQIKWKVPIDQFVKINFDASFCKHKSKSCSGILIRDRSGSVLCSRTTIHENILSSFVVKAVACFQVVEMSIQIGLSKVEIEGDFLAVI